MAYRTDDLLGECADAALGAGDSIAGTHRSRLAGLSVPNLTRSTFDWVWSAVMQAIRSNMKRHLGTNLPGLGRLVFDKGNKKPYFILSEHFVKSYRVKFRQDRSGPVLPTKDLNFVKVSQWSKCSKDVAKTVWRELVSHLGDVVKDANNQIDLAFKGIGALYGNRLEMRFQVGEQGKKMPRRKSAATFVKNAPTTAAGLAVATSAGGGGPATSTTGRLPSVRSSRSEKDLSASASAPQLHKGLSVSRSIKQQRLDKEAALATGRSAASRRKVAASSGRKKLPLNMPPARRGHVPKLLDDNQLKEINLDLMRQREQEQQEQREAEEREFRNNVLRLHAEAVKEQEDIEQEKQRHRDFALEQHAHAQRVEARKFEEMEMEKTVASEHWPFSREEDVRRKQRESTRQLQDTLDQQVREQGKQLAREHRPKHEPDPSNQETWVKLSEGNIYPKFLTPSMTQSKISGQFSELPVMRLGYERYAKELQADLQRLQQKELDIKKRAAAQESEIKRRAALRRKVNEDTVRYQSKQVAFDRRRRREEHQRNFLEADPEPGRAYPIEQLRDGHRLNRIKAGLRNALDAQINTRKAIREMKDTIEKAEDNYFLGCVQEQLEMDRAFRMKKRQDEQRVLMNTWKRQEDLTKQIRKMQKMRDGLVVRNGTQVESIDDVTSQFKETLARS